ncbi:MAG: hypothetical protein IAF94_16285 [Pirellulaceae bacterium]|nr:hypothetical protein [Pirellulaceae bacterium]
MFGSSVAAVVLAATSLAADAGLKESGKPELKSAGPIAFGPPGVLFVADPQSAAIFAIGVDAPAKAEAKEVKVDGIDAKVAAALGTKAGDLTINDLAVQPGTGNVFLSVSRGKGPDAQAVIVRTGADGKISALPLEKVSYSKLALGNAPDAGKKDKRGNSQRTESITDLAYFEGKLFIAGLSNEEFASKLRSVAWPFQSAESGVSVEIYHGAHGALETRSPVRTFVPFNVGGEPQLLAAYTCTPLVRFPISELKEGAKVRGTTIAELGNQNRPLDIIAYEKDGKSFLLIANSARGVMKVSTDGIEKQAGITERVSGTAGVKYDTVAELKGVEQLDKLDDKHAVLLVKAEGGLNLQTIALP